MANNYELGRKKGLRNLLTAITYTLLVFILLSVLPVVVPMIFGYKSMIAGKDTTGLVSNGSVVYVKDVDCTELVSGNIFVAKTDSVNDKVTVYYVGANDRDARALTARNGENVAYYLVKGRVEAKTPIVGYLSQLCYSAIGIVVLVLAAVVMIVLSIVGNKLGKDVSKMNAEN